MINAEKAREISKRNRKVALEAEVLKLIEEATSKGLNGFRVYVDYMDDSYPTVLQNLTFLGYKVFYCNAPSQMQNEWTVSW